MTRQPLFPQRIEGIRSPSLATNDQLRLCRSERDAVLASITISGLTYAEIGARCGVTKQAVQKWTRSGIPHSRVRAFCNATGTRMTEQYDAHRRPCARSRAICAQRDYIDAIVRAA